MFPCRPFSMVGDWRWCQDHLCKFESWCLNIFFNTCVVFAQIGLLIKIVHLLYYLTIYVSKLPCGTHTKSKWKWILKYADCDIRKRMSNCYLSVKHMQSSSYLLMSKKNHQYCHLYYHCIIYGALARLEVRGKEVFIFFLFIVHHHSDLKVPYSNLTIDKQFYLQKHILQNCFCFAKYTDDLYKNMNYYVSP
jgi:hypothetical protein